MRSVGINGTESTLTSGWCLNLNVRLFICFLAGVKAWVHLSGVLVLALN
jgi:hypothetical protein